MLYPKIDSLYKREYTTRDTRTNKIIFLDKGKSKNRLIIGDYAREEFEAIDRWSVTEKVDGTNVRIMYKDGEVTFGGRTENASIPCPLFKHLQETFTQYSMNKAFPCKVNEPYPHVVLFGEGYGGKIQLSEKTKKSPYRDSSSFILFDVFINGWWLEPKNIDLLAMQMHIDSVPYISNLDEQNREIWTWTKEQIEDFVRSKPKSMLNTETVMEGIIARSEPQMLFRSKPVICDEPLTYADYHVPIMFKLKCKDFE